MKRLAWLVATFALAACVSVSRADEAATWSFSVGEAPASVRGAVKVAPDSIVVDLSSLLNEAKIFRAVLQAERDPKSRTAVEVMPAADGATPLALLPPRYCSLNATEAVSKALAGGSGKVELVVKRFDGWKRETTRLDVSFVGGAAKGKIASVGKVAAQHRNGQTLLTWTEVESPLMAETITFADWRKLVQKAAADPRQIRYRIYRSSRPLSVDTIAEAEFVDEVGQLTGWNPGRYARDPRPSQEVPRFAIEDGKPPVTPGTGVYAHNPAEAGKAWYGVSVAVNGEEDFSKLAGVQGVAGPVEEEVGPGDPILQRTETPRSMNYVNNPTLHYYVRWECPPRANTPSTPLDYRVGIPEKVAKPAPLGVHLHCWGANLDGGYGWWYKASDGAMMIASNQLPYDWWVAYHENMGTWRAWDEGVTRDFTPKRMLAFADWVATKWDVDKSRLFVAGASMGGSGTSMLSVRYGDRFAFGVSWVGIHIARESSHFCGSYEGVCGQVKDGFQHESGLATFDYLDNAYLLRKNPARDIAFLTFANAKNDSAIGWPQAVHFVQALQETRQPHLFVWGQSGHGQRAYVPTLAGGGDGGPALTGYVDFRLDQSLPAFTRCSLDDDIGTGAKPAEPREAEVGNKTVKDPYDGDATGQINQYLRWKTDDVVDKADGWSMTVYLIGSSPQETCQVDITPRRLQQFKPKAGEKFKWTTDAGQSGQATADKWGLLTLDQVNVTKKGVRVTISR